MRVGRVLAGVLALGAVCGTAASAQAASTVPSDGAPTSAAAATASRSFGDTCSATYFDADPRLGPETLPAFGRVGAELVFYRRSGTLTPQQLLARYYDPSANSGAGGWIYPPQNGYLLAPGGSPIEWQQALAAGQDIDRYGSEYGSFLAPEGLPYAARSIPPQSLDGTPAAGCNYHDYRVLKPFSVHAGPIAPWFAQPGYGLQYQLDAALVPGAPSRINVQWLVDNGYLARLVQE